MEISHAYRAPLRGDARSVLRAMLMRARPVHDKPLFVLEHLSTVIAYVLYWRVRVGHCIPPAWLDGGSYGVVGTGCPVVAARRIADYGAPLSR
eukprot:4679436-Alexandrium_andersonii.AAC.1